MLADISLTTAKDIASIGDFLVKFIVVVIGGYVSTRFYFRRRQIYPRAKLNCDYRLLTINKGSVLLRIDATLINTGDVLVTIERGYANLNLLAPCDSKFAEHLSDLTDESKIATTDLHVPLLKKCEYVPKKACLVEPHEEESITFDFVLPNRKFRIIEATVYISNSNVKERELGWSKTLLIDLSHCDAKGASDVKA